MNRICAVFIILVSSSALAASPAAPPSPTAAKAPATAQPALSPTELNRDIISRLLQALPLIAAAASQEKAQFLSGITGGAPTKRLDPNSPQAKQQQAKLQTIALKHGFTLEEFALKISILMSAYWAVDRAAFERMLPTRKHPRIAQQLRDPALSSSERQAIEERIARTQRDKNKLYAQLAGNVPARHRRLVAAMLPAVRRAFRQAETTSPTR